MNRPIAEVIITQYPVPTEDIDKIILFAKHSQPEQIYVKITLLKDEDQKLRDEGLIK